MRNMIKKIITMVKAPTHMQLSVLCFILSLGLSIFLWIRAVLSRGNLTTLDGGLGIAAALIAAAGFMVPLYGHYIVGAAEKTDYRWGLALNGFLFLILVFFYFLGL